MKRWLVIILLVVAIGVIGFAVFLATFDANRYRPMVISKLEAALGRPVQLDRLSLGWRSGVALELHGMAVASGAPEQAEPAVQIETISAVVRLGPLLKRDIQLASLALIRPRLHLERGVDGGLHLKGLKSLNAGAGASGGPAQVAMPLLIASLTVEDGWIRVSDQSRRRPMDLTVKALDMTVKNVSLVRPVDVQARLALFSEDQNVAVKGRVHPPTRDRATLIEALRVETDFSRLNAAELAQAIPAFKSLGLQDDLRGVLSVEIDRAVLDPNELAQLTARVHLTGGRVTLATSARTYEELTVAAVAHPGRLELEQLSATIGEGTVTATGTIDQLRTTPHATFQLTANNIRLEDLTPPVGPTEPQVQGHLTASFQGDAQGVTWEQISRTLSGKGTITIAEGTIRNLNVLAEAFRRLAMLPGLVESLQARLPDTYQAKLAARDTVFEPIELPVTAEQGVLQFGAIRLVSETFALSGSGAIGLDRALSSQWLLRVDAPLSAAIIQSVNELRYLSDPTGQLELPIVLQGTLPRVAVLPDLQYVAVRLLRTKAEDFLGGLLQKAIEQEALPQ